jgi:hypothetical protein
LGGGHLLLLQIFHLTDTCMLICKAKYLSILLEMIIHRMLRYQIMKSLFDCSLTARLSRSSQAGATLKEMDRGHLANTDF